MSSSNRRELTEGHLWACMCCCGVILLTSAWGGFLLAYGKHEEDQRQIVIGSVVISIGVLFCLGCCCCLALSRNETAASPTAPDLSEDDRRKILESLKDLKLQIKNGLREAEKKQLIESRAPQNTSGYGSTNNENKSRKGKEKEITNVNKGSHLQPPNRDYIAIPVAN